MLLTRESLSRFQPLWEESDQFSRDKDRLRICNSIIKIRFVTAFKSLACNAQLPGEADMLTEQHTAECGITHTCNYSHHNVV